MTFRVIIAVGIAIRGWCDIGGWTLGDPNNLEINSGGWLVSSITRQVSGEDPAGIEYSRPDHKDTMAEQIGKEVVGNSGVSTDEPKMHENRDGVVMPVESASENHVNRRLDVWTFRRMDV